MKTQSLNTTQTHHYFATSAFAWGDGATRQEAINKVARMTGAGIIKEQAKQGGVYCWTCRVDVPQSTKYRINNYQPQEVPCSEPREYRIQNVKGYVTVSD